MNQRRHFNSIVSIAVLSAISTMAMADAKERGPGWNNGSPPVFHTNQDGPWGSQAPVTPIDILNVKAPSKPSDPPSLTDLVTEIGFHAPIDGGPEPWSPSGLELTDVSFTATAPSSPAGLNPVPGPASLLVLAMAGLAGRRRRS
jgi:hypothetical protein